MRWWMARVQGLFGVLPTLLGISLIAFFVIRLAPGDPVLLMIGERGADQAQYAQMVERLGLDEALPLQYLHFIGNALLGDLGTSVVSGRTVLSEILSRWPATMELGFAAIAIALIVGVPAGVLAAVKRDTWFDRLVTVISLIGYSMPIFWLGLVLILMVSVLLGWTPVSGRLGIEYEVPVRTGFLLIDTVFPDVFRTYGLAAFFSAMHHLILPSLTMAAVPLAVFARITRSSMLYVLGEDYIRTARAKGLAERQVIWKHALKNALLPIITVGGLFFISAAIAGAILTESIFGWPGIGSYVVSSVNARDYPVIQGCILLIGVLVVVTNRAVDRLYRMANPKMRS
ncbi:ABC transporter permease [Pseudomonas sp. SZ57]|uniref:ABC transporter permease n=1 Tax=Pseudomonas sp. SZ57 TaxID=2662259 RepID=UPI001C4984BA|nr:ABC transporter permease [Pseudomonas sp. SZ57]